MKWVMAAVVAAATLVWLVALPHVARAQDYPSHAIRLVLPQPRRRRDRFDRAHPRRSAFRADEAAGGCREPARRQRRARRR